ncbi:hypothetical protein C8A00DRAFT_16322 [Chaetomidium leptoderma]|uniref:Uncharacterized protein n=1 Tax=Chaetomidium leptoderma TaxID=669021 RepID=A0AAN6ZW11_9PEZI|nr:hypothetical protein C8A00DRAFT_16322 [Chaetomidium leptoderma]
MLAKVSRTVLPGVVPLTKLFRRQFSVKAIYSSFPATLLYYSPRQRSSLYDIKESDSRPDDLYDEAIHVEKDGLVYPAVTKNSGWFG